MGSTSCSSLNEEIGRRWWTWINPSPRGPNCFPKSNEHTMQRVPYPPDLQDEAVKTVLAQANLLCAEGAA